MSRYISDDWLLNKIYDLVNAVNDFAPNVYTEDYIPIGEWQSFNGYVVEMRGEKKPKEFRITRSGKEQPPTNADKFREVFGIYATELWAMPEADFLEWLNTERKDGANE